MSKRIDRSLLTAEDAFFLDEANKRMKERRARNLAAHHCINETAKGTHGLATVGVRCKRCALVHKYGAVIAHGLPEYKLAKPVFETAQVLGEEGSSHSAAGIVRSAATHCFSVEVAA